MKRYFIFTLALALCIFSFSFLTNLAYAERYVVSTQKDPLLIRDAPHGGMVIGKIPKGTVVDATPVGKYSAKVTYKGVTGYIYTGYLKPAHAKSPSSDNASSQVFTPTTKHVRLKSGYLHVRTGPGLSYKIIDKLYSGELVKVMSSKAGWAEIVYKNGKKGYVSEKYLK